MADVSRPAQGLINTSVVIDLDHLDAAQLPMELAISAVTMAELAAGPHATADEFRGLENLLTIVGI